MQKSLTPARKKRVAASKSDGGAATSRVEARKSEMDALPALAKKSTSRDGKIAVFVSALNEGTLEAHPGHAPRGR